jgi:uncharacterized protein
MPMHSLSELFQNFSAVIVTGGSSGIGKSFISHIRSLSREILICNLSRRIPEEAEALNLRHFDCDLSQAEAVERTVAKLESVLAEESPDGRVLLINNGGFGSYGLFPEPNLENQLAMVDVNVRAVVQLTGRLLPLLKARGGAIVNLASTTAFQPTPWAATYGASKAFVLHWSLALNQDLRGTGVHVLAVCPGPTQTEFFKRAGLGGGKPLRLFGQSADEVVLASLRALAAARTQVVTGWWNKLGAAAGSIFPKPLVAQIARVVIARYRMGK